MSPRICRLVSALCGGALIAAEPQPGGQHVPWLAEVQVSPGSDDRVGPSLPPLMPKAVAPERLDAVIWEQRRTEMRRDWLTFLGPLSSDRLAGGPSPPEVTVLEDVVADGIRRQLWRYEVEPGQPVEAYLLTPEPLVGTTPGVVVFHSTVPESIRQPAGVQGAPEKAFGLQLAQRGCIALCPRNYLWPENGRLDARGETARLLARQPASKGMDRMLLDALAAVDLLAAHPQVDAARIGCIGHSLGAKEALYLAAFDDRVRATVSSEGGVGIPSSNWHDPWYLGAAVRNPEFDRGHHELVALVAPRAFLLVGGDSADGEQSWPYIATALPVYRLYTPQPPLGLLNHHQGHTVPPEAHARMLEWLLTYLQ